MGEVVASEEDKAHSTIIAADIDVVAVRQDGRKLAEIVGFTGSELTVIATAISEIARNIVTYAGSGEITITIVDDGVHRGISVIASDNGPGIANIEKALQDGYSTGKSLGLGLPGAKRLMDEFEIVSELESGTTITMKKWVHAK